MNSDELTVERELIAEEVMPDGSVQRMYKVGTSIMLKKLKGDALCKITIA